MDWLGSPGGTARRVLLSTSPKRNSDTVQLKDTAMVSRAFSNSLLSDSLLHS